MQIFIFIEISKVDVLQLGARKYKQYNVSNK